jgi:rhodanese-related sulfurtransferase
MALMQVPPAALPDWLQHLANDGAEAAQAVMLDVREAWELQTATVQATQGLPTEFKFVHIPMGQLQQCVVQLNTDVPIAVLCHHGTRSLHVAHWLASQGFEHIANVQGGIDAWSRQLDAAVALY